MDTRIYIMSHKNFEVPFEKGYLPLQVGSEGSIDLGYLKDNSGNQISEKNKSYCELTGMYWIWKNVECEHCGGVPIIDDILQNGKVFLRVHYRKYC